MAFMFGPFAQGLSSGINNGLSLYEKWTDMSNRADAMNDIKKAKDADKAGKSGLDPTKGGALDSQAGNGPYGNIQSDSAASAPKTSAAEPNISDMPPPWKDRVGAGLSVMGDNPWGKTSSDAANKGAYNAPDGSTAGPMKDQQFQPGVSTSPSNMRTYDTTPGQPGALDGPSPPSIGQQRGSGPDMSHLTNRPVGSAIGDWIHGRQPGQPPTYLPTHPTPTQPQGQAMQGAPRGNYTFQPDGTTKFTPAAPSPAPTLGKPSVGAAILGAFGTTPEPQPSVY